MDNTLTILSVKHNDFIEEVTPEIEVEMVSTDKPFIQANTISKYFIGDQKATPHPGLCKG